ncbi:hypothetical protein O181_087927 [Austropuccinia psidii MF-1]|uniref:Uncharacterized protein n=1 Tax=Austropuccinia psidii MF-1 TaxID=1389203 RepID=A0A9Q3P435_9BASI|nr:hypothetical protein [Austropuccinia psidii MF-1]
MRQYKQYYTVYKDKDWEMLPQIHQGEMHSWHILENFLKEKDIVRYFNGWNPLSYKPLIKKIKEYHAKKKKESKEEAPVASTRKPQAKNFPRREEQEKSLEKTIFPNLKDPKNPKSCHGQCLQHGQNLDGIQGQRGKKNKTTSFSKEIKLSPDVVNTLTEIKNIILPLKEIERSLLSLQEINNSLSSLTKIVVKNKKEIDNMKFMAENNKSKFQLTILKNKLDKLSISVETFEEKTSSHQKLLLDHVEKSNEARMTIKDDIKREIRLITEKMDKINEDNINMPKLSTPVSHIRIAVKQKEEINNPFMTELSNKDNKKVLMKEAPQLKEWQTFTGEGEYDPMPFIKKIDML